MLHDIYLHEMLAKAAAKPGKHEIAALRALAALPRRPSPARRVARLCGRLLIQVGAWLLAYGADHAQPPHRPGMVLAELGAHYAPPHHP